MSMTDTENHGGGDATKWASLDNRREDLTSAKSILPPLRDNTMKSLAGHNKEGGDGLARQSSHGGGVDGGGESQMATRENTKTEVQSLGMGRKTATLFLSRTHSMMKGRSSSQTVKMPDTSNLSKSHTQMTAGSRQLTKTDVVSEQDEELMKAMGLKGVDREFTFTGYELEEDVGTREATPQGLDEEEIVRLKYTKIYHESCRKLGVLPVGPISKSLTDSHVVLKTRGLGVQGARAIAIALVGNKRVKSLDLQDNWIGADGALSIAEMTRGNNDIVDINISDNRIGTKGIRAISDAMANNRVLRKLDISGSNLFDHDARYVGILLEKNYCLQELKVAHNKFGELGGLYLGPAIANNETLQILDLSWNHLRGKGAMAVAAGLGLNLALKVVDISFNGFCARSCKILGESLKENNSLRELDISNNRMDAEAIGGLMKGIQVNETLTSLKIGYNMYTPDVATVILRAIVESDNNQIRELDMAETVVEAEFTNLVESTRKKRLLLVKHGPVIKKGESVVREGEAISGFTDPVQALYEYMSQKGYRIIDLFKRFDTDRSMSITRDEFFTGLVQAHVPMTVGQLEELMDKLDNNKDGSVDLKELMDGEKLYRRKSIRKKLRRESQDKMTRKQRAGSLPEVNLKDKRRSSVMGLPSLVE